MKKGRAGTGTFLIIMFALILLFMILMGVVKI